VGDSLALTAAAKDLAGDPLQKWPTNLLRMGLGAKHLGFGFGFGDECCKGNETAGRGGEKDAR
jgi:hypothetical protein